MPSNRVVHKYRIPLGLQATTLELADAEILHVDTQNHEPTIWVEEDYAPTRREARLFRWIGTGHLTPRGWTHVGTIMSGEFVWHLYEAPRGV